VLDDQGRVHAYPKPLTVRMPAGHPTIDHPVENFGGVQGREPLRVGVILVTAYRPSSVWRPRRQSAGQGALALMSNTLPARDRPARALAATRRAAEGALVLEGERGEAAMAAAGVLAIMDGSVDTAIPTT
jgi:hypothetical protein